MPGGGGGRRVVPRPRHAAVLPETTTAMVVAGDPGPPARLRPSRTGTGLGRLPRRDSARSDGKERAGGCGKGLLLCGFKGAPGQLSVRPSGARLGAGSQVLPGRSQAGNREAPLSEAVRMDGLF